MNDITKLAQSLKAAAEKAGADSWQAKKISGDFYVIRKGSYKLECGYTTYQPIAEIDHKPTRDYVAMANPTNTLALVEALEKAQQRIAELESRTVKMPHRNLGHHKLFLLCPFPYYDAEDMEKALAAAGIKVEAE
nr:MAG TPA: Ead/Ea22-like protein [Caudoviricetes sp.]